MGLKSALSMSFVGMLIALGGAVVMSSGTPCSPATAAATCSMAAEAQPLAMELVAHIDGGTLVGLNAGVLNQIRWVSQGSSVPNCGIDLRVLQIMVIAVRNFDRVGISSINRKCGVGLISDGTEGSHVRGGGGKAVDFYMLDGRMLTGADGLSIRLIGVLDPVVPPGTRIGQSYCRAFANASLALTNFTQFADNCTHLHIDVAYTDAALAI